MQNWPRKQFWSSYFKLFFNVINKEILRDIDIDIQRLLLYWWIVYNTESCCSHLDPIASFAFLERLYTTHNLVFKFSNIISPFFPLLCEMRSSLTRQNMCQPKSWGLLSYQESDFYKTKCYCNFCPSLPRRCDGPAGSVKRVITRMTVRVKHCQAARFSDFRNLYWTKLTAFKKHTKFWLLLSELACSYL